MRSRRIDALTHLVDAQGARAEFANRILRRIDGGQGLSQSMLRFCRQLDAGFPEPGDSDYTCICERMPDGSHVAHCLRSQRVRKPAEVA